jgi:hypothetical protein
LPLILAHPKWIESVVIISSGYPFGEKGVGKLHHPAAQKQNTVFYFGGSHKEEC